MTKRYDGMARTLHWIMAILIIFMMLAGMNLEDVPATERTVPLMGHSGIGMVLLILVAIRLWWRRGHPAPPYPDSMSARDQKISKGVVHLFYALMIYQPVVGLLHAATYVDASVQPFGLFNVTALLPSGVGVTQFFHVLHGIGFSALALLTLLHIAATLKHWLIDKDEIPHRMIPFVKAPK